MSIALMAMVWDSEMPTPSHKLVLLALADFANDQGLCWPSVATIARKSQLSRASVQRALKRLREMGVIEVTEQATWQHTPTYRIRGINLTPLTENRGVIVNRGGITMTPKPPVTRTSYPVTRKPRNRLTSSSEPSNNSNSENNFFENRYKTGKRQS